MGFEARRVEMSVERIVSDFYAAAAGRVAWAQPLNDLADELGLWCSQIVGVDKRRGLLLFNAYGGTLPHAAMLDYVRRYHEINPRLAPTLATPPDQWMNCHQHFDEAFVATDRFYQEYLIPYGGRYMSATKLVENGEVSFMLGLFRGIGRPPLGDADAQSMASIKLHLS
jgi:hypothetical protein